MATVSSRSRIHRMSAAVMKLRRSGVVTPTSIAGLKFWLDASKLTVADGSPVATWSDSSGNGQDATAAGTARPTFRTNGTSNGHAAVEFDGVANVLATSAPVSTAVDNFSLFAVASLTSGTTQSPFLSNGDLGSSGYGPAFSAYSDGSIGFLFGSVVWGDTGTAATAGRAYVMELTRASGTAAFALDGVAPSITYPFGGATSAPVTPATATYLGRGGSAQPFIACRIAEVLVYESLTSANRTAITTYLKTKYGVA